MLVFSTNQGVKYSNWGAEYQLLVTNKILSQRFKLLHTSGVIAHESTLYRFTPLGLSLGHYDKVIGNCRTHEKHRGKGLYGCMISYIVKNHCVNTPILFVEDNNLSSIKGLQKIGFSVTDRIKILKRGFLGLYYSIEKN